jgi:hypothetical protein
MPVAMELSRIIISEINSEQVIYLKEIDGTRTFPILIGFFEATSIDRRVKHHEAPRPLTHDLLVNAVEQLGGQFQDVVISELKDHTYYDLLRGAARAAGGRVGGNRLSPQRRDRGGRHLRSAVADLRERRRAARRERRNVM